MEGKPPSPEGLGEQNYRQHHDQDQSDEDDEGLLFVGHGCTPCLGTQKLLPFLVLQYDHGNGLP